jgi:cytosine/adenosine deaminase-related metal-dependent hydrolase
MVDLKGRTLLPGFVDPHGHVTGGGMQAISANLLAPPMADRLRGEMWLALGFTCEASPIDRPSQVA